MAVPGGPFLLAGVLFLASWCAGQKTESQAGGAAAGGGAEGTARQGGDMGWHY
jgi:hypothetical protein